MKRSAYFRTSSSTHLELHDQLEHRLFAFSIPININTFSVMKIITPRQHCFRADLFTLFSPTLLGEGCTRSLTLLCSYQFASGLIWYLGNSIFLLCGLKLVYISKQCAILWMHCGSYRFGFSWRQCSLWYKPVNTVT